MTIVETAQKHFKHLSPEARSDLLLLTTKMLIQSLDEEQLAIGVTQEIARDINSLVKKYGKDSPPIKALDDFLIENIDIAAEQEGRRTVAEIQEDPLSLDDVPKS